MPLGASLKQRRKRKELRMKRLTLSVVRERVVIKRITNEKTNLKKKTRRREPTRSVFRVRFAHWALYF